MKGWTSILNFTFTILDWLAHLVLSPMTLMIAIGFILFTAIIGRQLQSEAEARWTRVA